MFECFQGNGREAKKNSHEFKIPQKIFLSKMANVP